MQQQFNTNKDTQLKKKQLQKNINQLHVERVQQEKKHKQQYITK